MNNATRATALAVCLLSFLGCSAYRPRSPRSLSSYTSEASKSFSPGWLAAYNAMPEATAAEQAAKQEVRNSLLSEMVWLVDRNYGRFETAFYANKATEDIAGDFAGILLGGATVFTGSTHAKTVLSVVAAAATGGKASIDAHWYNTQTRDAIVAEMRALRTSQLASIMTNMGQPLSEYPLSQGLLDVQDYYQDGSISSALQAISQSAVKDATAAKATLDGVKRK